jgi:hypothetical protein
VDGAASEREISLTVPRGSRPVSSFLSGKVTEKPGTYTLNIGLDATRATSDSPVRIAEQHPVIVNVATASAERRLSPLLNLADRPAELAESLQRR